MTTIRLLLRVGIVVQLLCAVVVQAAEPLAVVASPESSLTQLTREDVAAAFLGEKRLVRGGEQIVALDVGDDAVRQQFYNLVAHRSLIQIRAYWAKMVFTGNGRPPLSLPLDKLMERLRADPNAIGYLPISKSGEFKTILMLSN